MLFKHICVIIILFITVEFSSGKICIKRVKVPVTTRTRSFCDFYPKQRLCRDHSAHTRYKWEKEYKCCPGWITTRSKAPCATPVCFGKRAGGCLNGGVCVAPNVCQCKKGYTSPRCSRADDRSLRTLCKKAFDPAYRIKGVNKTKVREMCVMAFPEEKRFVPAQKEFVPETSTKTTRPVQATTRDALIRQLENITPGLDSTTAVSMETPPNTHPARRVASKEHNVTWDQIEHLCTQLYRERKGVSIESAGGDSGMSVGLIMGIIGLVGIFVTVCGVFVCVVAYCKKTKIKQLIPTPKQRKSHSRSGGKTLGGYLKRLFVKKKEKEFRPVRRRVVRRRSSVF